MWSLCFSHSLYNRKKNDTFAAKTTLRYNDNLADKKMST
jgi:hypothetical protein